MKQQSGFTLIELMIAVAIIGILASIALPAFQDYTKKSHVLEGLHLASGVKTAMWDFWAINGTFPSNNSSLGISNTMAGNSVNSIIVSGGVITITYNTKVSNGSTIELAITDTTNGIITWDCTGGNMNDKYRPIDCR